jgi:RNA ligase
MDWTVSAQTLEKFFNLGEPGSDVSDLPQEPFGIFEKMDGSLGIFYRDRDGLPTLATRGSFESEQAKCGTAMLRSSIEMGSVPDNLTLLFEIIYSENKSVIQYDFDGLVLLAIYDRFTGVELPWQDVKMWGKELGFRVPEAFNFSSLDEAITVSKGLPSHMEGYVVRFENGKRVKLKGEAYLKMHRLVWSISKNKVHQLLIDGDYSEFLVRMPEEFRPEVESFGNPLIDMAREFEKQAYVLLSQAPKDNRKQFALWVMNNAPENMRTALFRLLDNNTPNWFECVV